MLDEAQGEFAGRVARVADMPIVPVQGDVDLNVDRPVVNEAVHRDLDAVHGPGLVQHNIDEILRTLAASRCPAGVQASVLEMWDELGLKVGPRRPAIGRQLRGPPIGQGHRPGRENLEDVVFSPAGVEAVGLPKIVAE